MKFLAVLAALGLAANGFENAQMFETPDSEMDMDMAMDMNMDLESTESTAGCTGLKQGQMFRDSVNHKVMLRINGQCHWVTNAVDANNLFVNWQGRTTLRSHAEAVQCWEGAPLKKGALLITGDKTRHVYLLSHQAHRIKNPATFNAFGFDWKKIRVYPQAVVDAIQKGEQIGGY